jgi:hypothetical protein
MVKMRHKGLLVLGITRQEMSALRDGAPLPVPLEDVGLKGQHVLIIPGEDNAALNRVMQMAAQAYDNGATSTIEIAKALPKGSKIH